MDQQAILVTYQSRLDQITELLKNEWLLDHSVKGNPFKLNNGVIYHLVKFEPSEIDGPNKWPDEFLERYLGPDIMKPESRVNPLADIMAMRMVTPDEVEKTVKEGFTVHAIYAKGAMMVKRPKVKNDD